VVAVIAIALFASLGAAYLMTTLSQADRAESSEDALTIMNIAEAGVAAALYDLKQGNTGEVEGNFGTGSYATTVSQSGDYYTIQASATLGEWSREIEVVVEQVVTTSSVSVCSTASARRVNPRASIRPIKRP
jgi:hypothetical protein